MPNRFSWLRPQVAEWMTPSVVILVAANLVPLYGVCFLRWQVFPIMLLFWLENVVVGGFNVLKMLLASPAEPDGWVVKLFMIPFFWVHYGGFAGGHLLFVLVLFGGFAERGSRVSDVASFWRAISDLQIGWAALALLLSHAASFFLNYIGKGEFRTAKVRDLMMGPYGRVVLLHVTLIFGGMLILALGSPVPALVLLLVLKTFIDVQAHVREHREGPGVRSQESGVRGGTSGS